MLSPLTFELYRPLEGLPPLRLPFFGHKIHAGFPSPADDYIESRLSLDEHLIQHKESTFFVRATGNSMVGAGIFNGDLLVVDKGLDAQSGDIVVAVVDGEFTVKYLHWQGGAAILRPANARYKDIVLQDGQELQVWGVVTSTVKQFRR